MTIGNYSDKKKGWFDRDRKNFSPVSLTDFLLSINSTCTMEMKKKTGGLETEEKKNNNNKNLTKTNTSSFTSFSVYACEITYMLKTLKDLRKLFPSWAYNERNWLIHNHNILCLGILNEGIREGYRAAFQIAKEEKILDGEYYTKISLLDLIENLNILKTAHVSCQTPVSYLDKYDNNYQSSADEGNLSNNPQPFNFFDMRCNAVQNNDNNYNLHDPFIPNVQNNNNNHTDKEKVLQSPIITETKKKMHVTNSQYKKSFNIKFENLETKLLSDTIENEQIVQQCNNGVSQTKTKFNGYKLRKYRKPSSKYVKNNDFNCYSPVSLHIKHDTQDNYVNFDNLLNEEVGIKGCLNGRSLPPEFQSGIKGVVWNRYRKVWEATWKTINGKRCWLSFRADKYGFEEAKRLAVECRIKYSTQATDEREIIKHQNPLIEESTDSFYHLQHKKTKKSQKHGFSSLISQSVPEEIFGNVLSSFQEESCSQIDGYVNKTENSTNIVSDFIDNYDTYYKYINSNTTRENKSNVISKGARKGAPKKKKIHPVLLNNEINIYNDETLIIKNNEENIGNNITCIKNELNDSVKTALKTNIETIEACNDTSNFWCTQQSTNEKETFNLTLNSLSAKPLNECEINYVTKEGNEECTENNFTSTQIIDAEPAPLINTVTVPEICFSGT